MSNNETPLDVELPPVPEPDHYTRLGGRYYHPSTLDAYGLACAQAVADAKDSQLQAASARIAELELARDSDYEFDAMRHDRDRLRLESEQISAERDTLQQRVGELEGQLEAKGADAERWKHFLSRRFVMAGNLVVMDSHRTALDDELISAIDREIAARSPHPTAGADQQQEGGESNG